MRRNNSRGQGRRRCTIGMLSLTSLWMASVPLAPQAAADPVADTVNSANSTAPLTGYGMFEADFVYHHDTLQSVVGSTARSMLSLEDGISLTPSYTCRGTLRGEAGYIAQPILHSTFQLAIGALTAQCSLPPDTEHDFRVVVEIEDTGVGGLAAPDRSTYHGPVGDPVKVERHVPWTQDGHVRGIGSTIHWRVRALLDLNGQVTPIACMEAQASQGLDDPRFQTS